MSGTITNPEKFVNIINSPQVVPGDTIVMRGGTYRGDFVVSINGTAELPITFQPYEGEVVNIVGGLSLVGRYIHWQNININQPNTAMYPVYIIQPGTQLTDCDISGGFIGVGWFGSGVGKLLRCTIHDTLSYGIYTHNDSGGLRELADCTFTDIGGYYSMHLYSESKNHIKDYLITGCEFDKPVIVHASYIYNVQFIENLFHTWLILGNSRTVEDIRQAVVTNNMFNGNNMGVHIVDFSDIEVTDNTFIITEFNNSQCNINIQTNGNEQRKVINNNGYTGGWFISEGQYYLTFAQWQALGYDLQGSYE